MKHVHLHELESGNNYLVYSLTDDKRVIAIDYIEADWNGGYWGLSKYCFISTLPNGYKVYESQVEEDDGDLSIPFDLEEDGRLFLFYELTEEEYLTSIAMRCI